MRFKKNEVIMVEDKKMVIVDLLGEGGQGEVYL